ncbi:MAG: biotin attachment protein [Armatimonadetes bacterium]|nr:biotin attachment protein [Armatimonadota bacterium]
MHIYVNQEKKHVSLVSKEVQPDGSVTFHATVDGKPVEGSWVPGHLLIAGRSIPYVLSRNHHGSPSLVVIGELPIGIQWPDQMPLSGKEGSPSAAGSAGQVSAPLNGQIVKILVQEGDLVAPGDVILVLEAMKMQNEISAHSAGKVRSIHVSAGQVVSAGQLLVEIQEG